jgi:glycosidase
LINLRKQYPCFENDRVAWLHNSDENNVVTFMRADDQDEFVVVINFSNRPVTGRVEVKNSESFKPVRISGMPDGAADGLPTFHLNGFEWRIYHRVVPK